MDTHSIGSIYYGILNEGNFNILQLLLLDRQSCFTILQPQKKQRLPLSVARPIMKKQKEREQKMVQEHSNVRQFGGMAGSSNSRRSLGRRKPEEQVLKSSEGFFKHGVLDVKHLLSPASSRNNGPARNSDPFRNTDFGNEMGVKGRRKGGKKKSKKSKKKGGGKKRH
ncbi:uncharacterized protein LOC120087770 isoform X2 [Benincasa hispida]|uniref:uncharacterized protein LOC120087770 isoform X2 n=1 Tax=Benincasa hispida TaxID=102211 RepID=UPI001900B7B3|nr:uncharacterized protein LOC120087770 isoform X2 [Benincasa hispida]